MIREVPQVPTGCMLAGPGHTQRMGRNYGKLITSCKLQWRMIRSLTLLQDIKIKQNQTTIVTVTQVKLKGIIEFVKMSIILL